MNRPDFLKLFAQRRSGAPAILGPGLASRELFVIEGEEPSILYNMDMPYAAAFCLGLALATGLPRVVALEGDGSMLGGLSTFTTIGRYRPDNLIVVILDNEAYGTFGVGEMRSATAFGVDLEQIARFSAITKARTVRTLSEAAEAFTQAFKEPGPWVIVAKLEAHGDTNPTFSRVPPDVVDAGIRFYNHLQSKVGATARRIPRRGASSEADHTREAKPQPLVRYREEAARLMHESLRASGVDFAVFLPDTVLHVVNQLLLDDPAVKTVMCSREDEGIGIAMGAFWGGSKPVVLMEGSGLGLSSLVLARGLAQRSPTLIICSHNSVLGERFNYHAATRLVSQPTLDALRIPYYVLRDPAEIPVIIREILVTMVGQRVPVAILVPRHVLIQDAEEAEGKRT